MANVAERWQGQGDSPLSETGRQQARHLGHRLRGRRFDVVIASDLSRAADTARAISRTVDLDAAWREIDVGRWEGMTREEVATRYGDEIRALRTDHTVPVGGGESWANVEARGMQAFSSLLSRLDDASHALVVAHGGILIALLRRLLSLPRDRMKCLGRLDNTSMTTLSLDDSGLTLQQFNDVSHIGTTTAFARRSIEGGDTIITILSPNASSQSPRRMELAREYDARDVLSGFELESRVRTLAIERPGEKLGLFASPMSANDFAVSTLALGGDAQATFGVPDARGSTQVVVGKHGVTVADFNIAI